MAMISVIVPVYQAEFTLKRCVESVLAQTFADFELLLIDDCSRGDSWVLAQDYAKKDSRVRVIRQSRNKGVSAARNRGLDEAKGEYIAFLDADDAYHPAFLETLYALLQSSGAESAGCAHWNCYAGERLPEKLLPEGLYGAGDIREQFIKPLVGERLTQPVMNGFIWRFLFSRKRVEALCLRFAGKYLEDELFLIEYFAEAQSLAVSEEPLYDYYFNPDSATRRYMKDYLKTYEDFLLRKEALVRRFGLDSLCPLWRESSDWASLLIAVGNEYAHGVDTPVRERQKNVETLCKRTDFAHAISAIRPQGLSRNKQLVADLIRGGHFFTLTQLYRLKNRI